MGDPRPDFYCDSCAYKRKWFWPTLSRILHKCGICGEERTCNSPH